MNRARTRVVVLCCAALGSACTSAPRHKAAPAPSVEVPPAPSVAAGAPNIAAIPDAVPRYEIRSRRGNPPFYDVLGKRYFVLATADGYVERGVASWYGPTFHGVSTSMGEQYDMYAMTAAHKTLPLPAYARVTNLKNGRSVVVRVNDRGPFVANRIIDLSYTAAAKLDMLREGTTLVEVRALTPAAPDTLTRSAELPPPELYMQAGAFADEANAERLAARLRAAGLPGVAVLPPLASKSRLYRVRVGPVASVAQFDQLAARLSALGIADARLAPE
ncbi:MAG TPA: septal ring lytic transglycosylase RlpA family protein [Steroidobacteraceae bacterium]|jgi:rare lipoprotein A|nr:septal ring lytic transglycosylase RlpA family protein [Steroidobacteraceae bacterium]